MALTDLIARLFSVAAATASPSPSPEAASPPAVERPASEQPSAPAVRPAADSAPLTCELRQSKRNGELMILAVVHAKAPAEGVFKLTLDKKDTRKNVVNSGQDGPFSVRAGESQTVADASLNVRRGDTLTGFFELRDTGGQLTARCGL